MPGHVHSHDLYCLEGLVCTDLPYRGPNPEISALPPGTVLALPCATPQGVLEDSTPRRVASDTAQTISPPSADRSSRLWAPKGCQAPEGRTYVRWEKPAATCSGCEGSASRPQASDNDLPQESTGTAGRAQGLWRRRALPLPLGELQASHR